MLSWIRVIKSIGVLALVCVVSIALIFILWEFAVGPANGNLIVSKYLLNPELQGDPEITEALVGELITLIQQAILLEIVVIFIICAAWIMLSRFKNLGWFLLVLGVLASALIPINLFQEQGDEFMRAELMTPVTIAFVTFFCVFSFLSIRLAGHTR